MEFIHSQSAAIACRYLELYAHCTDYRGRPIERVENPAFGHGPWGGQFLF